MTNTIQKILLTFFALCILFSCKTKSVKPDKEKDFVKEINAPYMQEKVFAENALLMEGIDTDKVVLQSFAIKADEKKWVTAKKGFKVFIDADKLRKKDGSPIKGNIAVHIKEVTNTDEMIAANTPTMSNGRMLISGGSYFLEVSNNNEALTLRENQSLQIQLPNLQKNNMQLFYGNYNKDGMVNWKPANNKFKKAAYESRDYTRSFYDSDYYIRQIKLKDTLGKRPANLQECFTIYKDSTYNARWDYTRLHRESMTHKQKMAYGLQPFKFPYQRFLASLVKKEKSCFNCRGVKPEFYYEPTMYYITDTVPVYKYDTVINTGRNKVAKSEVEYYEPVEITSLGWINCDQFYDVPICNNTEIQFSNSENLTSCRVYYNFKKLNSLLAEQIYFKKSALQFTASTRLPLGEQVEIIILAVQGGKLMTAKKMVTLARENKIAFELVEADKSKLRNFVKANT